MTAVLPLPGGAEPPQNLKEYDPEWGRAFWTGTVAASCDHSQMLAAVKTPVLLTHHLHMVDPSSGVLMGALSDLAANRAIELIAAAGNKVEYKTFPSMGHFMHGIDPPLFAATVMEWIKAVRARE